MLHRFAWIAVVVSALSAASNARGADVVPRPEHPRPDAVRAHWMNLNGGWDFAFDARDEGIAAAWFQPGATVFSRTIVVPFPWESELSGVHDLKAPKVGWYRRSFEVPADFPTEERVILRFEAVDWRADVWINGKKVGEHEGGYSPFEIDATDAVTRGKPSVVVVRAFDPTDPELPTGKQVGWYTASSGIWQTVWLESRPRAHVAGWTIKSAIDPAVATFEVHARGVDEAGYQIAIKSADPSLAPTSVHGDGGRGALGSTIKVAVKNPKLWSPDAPHLYDVAIELLKDGKVVDRVNTYFGLRTIARGTYGDPSFERILLNGKPLYLRAALDQSFNPKGVYTAPDDDFLKRDLLIAKNLGLNALRIHIKPDEPRRLYWADKLGVLILEDMPNTWRQSPRARKAWEATMREVVSRDRNHPSIMAWIAFNETWGLANRSEDYKKDRDTQDWVKRMLAAIRSLDATRLVEDHSPCNFDHVEGSDLNSWHFYIDDHAGAREHIAYVVDQTKPGSGFNYVPGQTQARIPLINSEYGGVSAGSGDRDVSWSFRDLTTQLRRHPKIQGYVYTELTDIEWEHNGFFNYDRTPKTFGYDAFIPGMTPAELQGDDFLGFDAPPVIVGRPGQTVEVPVFISHYSAKRFEPRIRWWLDGFDDHGDNVVVSKPQTVPASWKPYDVQVQKSITIRLPDHPFVGALNLTLRDPEDRRIAANFVNVVVRTEKPLPRAERDPDDAHDAVLRFEPGSFAKQAWTKVGTPPEGKVYGYGKGYFEYHLKVPEAVVKAGVDHIHVEASASSKAEREKVDWPSVVNRQDYPQTDARTWPSEVEISVNGKLLHREPLDDDWADARGVLSHLAGVDHGSHGDIVSGAGEVDDAVRAALLAGKPLVIRFTVPADAKNPGGLCLYGEETGRFPFDPSVTLHTKAELPAQLGVDPDASVAVDSAASRRVRLLAAGDSPRGTPATWSFTTNEPAAGWDQPNFDASAWARGVAGFGTTETPSVRVKTRWDGPGIWLRTTFEAPKLTPGDLLRLHVFHDEDVEVLLNGKPLFRGEGYTTAYIDVPLDASQRGLFREGKNTLAVRCRQTRGGQGVDLGLTLERAAP